MTGQDKTSAGEASPQQERPLESPKSPPPEDRGPPLDAAPPVRIAWDWKSSTAPQDPRLLVPNYGQDLESDEELPPSTDDAGANSGVADASNSSNSYPAAQGQSGHCLKDHERVLVGREGEERSRSDDTGKDSDVDQVSSWSMPLGDTSLSFPCVVQTEQ